MWPIVHQVLVGIVFAFSSVGIACLGVGASIVIDGEIRLRRLQRSERQAARERVANYRRHLTAEDFGVRG